MDAESDELLDRFAARLAGQTRENYRTDLAPWSRWLQERNIALLSASRDDVENYLAERRDAGLKPRTISTIIGHLRGFYRWGLEERLIPADPTALVRGPARGRSEARVWLGWGDLARLLEVSREWFGGELAAHVHLWALSGLRPGEPRRLRVEDLATHDGATTLAVEATKTQGRARIVLPTVTSRILQDVVAGRRRGVLLLNPRTGRPWTKGAERGRLIRLLNEAGLPPVTPYGLRTTFITLALDAGIPEREVMIGARHASSAQTAHYDRLRTRMTTPVGPRLVQALQDRRSH
ncbi:site-specific integrase [Actinomyces sp. 594]|uniref:tyrosine-type recombinase/integrase n=1 Tax=Actinomyces sp. 594 TaxID=2057793 RepID=UPI001C55E11F|nr:site-specific integrase [Actinomyces sp. 594]MBW3068581.1 site-specific integrase [Actinomyces sp. 594]